ncbi:hypothetical protein TNCV_3138881 [Trichonephila clavipes]|nr:hypothetical protein TNCV_3138881 [Trichonephila clavipes]
MDRIRFSVIRTIAYPNGVRSQLIQLPSRYSAVALRSTTTSVQPSCTTSSLHSYNFSQRSLWSAGYGASCGVLPLLESAEKLLKHNSGLISVMETLHQGIDWSAEFKPSRFNTDDAERSGLTESAVVPENVKNSFARI